MRTFSDEACEKEIEKESEETEEEKPFIEVTPHDLDVLITLKVRKNKFKECTDLDKEKENKDEGKKIEILRLKATEITDKSARCIQKFYFVLRLMYVSIYYYLFPFFIIMIPACYTLY